MIKDKTHLLTLFNTQYEQMSFQLSILYKDSKGAESEKHSVPLTGAGMSTLTPSAD